MNIRAVIFDMDETLTIGYDPDRDKEIDIHYLSWQAVLEKTGHVLSWSLYGRHLRGATNRVSEQWLLEQFGCPLEERLGDVKEAYYRDQLVDTYLHYRPGVDDCLNTLRANGIRLGLLTSAPRENVLAAERKLKLWERVDRQLALDVDDLADLNLEPKPSADGLLEIQRRLDLQASEILYVGDSTGDMQAGKRADIMTLGFVSGNDAQTLLDHGATETIGHFDELVPWLKTLE